MELFRVSLACRIVNNLDRPLRVDDENVRWQRDAIWFAAVPLMDPEYVFHHIVET